jgi:hypothetical protein
LPTLAASNSAKAIHARQKAERLAEIAAELKLMEEERKKAAKTRAGKRPVGDVVIEEFERNEEGELVKRRVASRKFLTTLDQLEKRGQLDKHLRNAFDALANAVSMSSGACIDDRDLRGSTSRGIAVWDSAANGAFGPRSFSDQMLKAERLRQYVMGQIPEEMMRLASQLIMEETGQTLERPAPLTEYGQTNGFQQEQQARSSGATMAIDICRVVHHALKSR